MNNIFRRVFSLSYPIRISSFVWISKLPNLNSGEMVGVLDSYAIDRGFGSFVGSTTGCTNLVFTEFSANHTALRSGSKDLLLT